MHKHNSFGCHHDMTCPHGYDSGCRCHHAIQISRHVRMCSKECTDVQPIRKRSSQRRNSDFYFSFGVWLHSSPYALTGDPIADFAFNIDVVFSWHSVVSLNDAKIAPPARGKNDKRGLTVFSVWPRC